MRRSRLALMAVLWVVTFAAAAAVGYLLRSQTNVTVLTARAYVGLGQASAIVDGWAYALPLDGRWRGADGSWRDSGPPACLSKLGTTAPISFGYVPVTGPSGASWRQVVWVSCIA
jgi:hypothetical protein